MRVDSIIKGLPYLELIGNTNLEIEAICFDSRKCCANSLFVAIDGEEQDGHKYIKSAIEKGAKCVIYQNGEAPDCEVAIKVSNSRKALGIIASNFYGNPSEKINLVGITGTNGKTTTATLLYQLFTDLGYCCGLLSTIKNYIDKESYETTHTTPDQIEINQLLAEMVKRGCEYCFMEVSSHSCKQDRIYGLTFKGAIFSNLTHDHLDYHKTFADYIKSKKIFFDSLGKEAFALTNIDDKNGLVMTQNCKAKIYTYSCRSLADFNCKIIESTFDGMLIKINGKELWSRFIGRHNGYNLLAVYSTAILLGANEDEVLMAISNLKSVSGRLEYIKGKKDITAVIDYAHTPDALENVLKTLREICNGQELICLFGCGGNRDKSKRPEMGKIAAQYADRVIVTSDNPRDESPEEIIKDIKGGMDYKERAKSLFISDRREAIRVATIVASPGAVILVAGKGHEDYQIIGKEKFHFDDKVELKNAFNELN